MEHVLIKLGTLLRRDYQDLAKNPDKLGVL
jgi:hypothetical protein